MLEEKTEQNEQPSNEVVEPQTEEEVKDLILGKFKTVEDLKTAYQNLQKQQGEQSVELGHLRKINQFLQMIADKKAQEDAQESAKQEYVENYLKKYDNENYFKNDAFKNLYQSAFDALGTDLDTDGFIEQLEKYVASRLLLKEQIEKAQNENETATDSLNFSNGVGKTPEKKLRFQDIPAEELEKYIAKYV